MLNFASFGNSSMLPTAKPSKKPSRLFTSVEKHFIIAEIEKRAYLWDKRTQGYQNTPLRDAGFAEIGASLVEGVSGDDVKAVWYSLRSQLAGYIRSGSGLDGKMVKWEFWDPLTFVRQLMVPRETFSTEPQALFTSSIVDAAHSGFRTGVYASVNDTFAHIIKGGGLCGPISGQLDRNIEIGSSNAVARVQEMIAEKQKEVGRVLKLKNSLFSLTK